jgi:hypothetical protein
MLALCIGIVSGHRRVARIGEDQPRDLSNLENLLRRKNAILCKDPARLSRRRIGYAVAGIVNEIVLLVDQQHRQFERVACLGARDHLVLRRFVQILLDVRVVLRAHAQRDIDLVLIAPGVLHLLQNRGHRKALPARSRQSQRAGAGIGNDQRAQRAVERRRRCRRG